MGKSRNIDIFDPADQPIGPELLAGPDTPEDAYIPDTNGDPEGSERRAQPEAVKLPDYFFKKYSLDGQGNPTFQSVRVDKIMEVFASKKDTPFVGPSTDDDMRQQEIDAYSTQVKLVVDGLMPLLEVDAPTTGINILQLCTRTWAEFASIAFEYKEDADSANPNEDLPQWLIEREDKMFQLGRKARMLRDVIKAVDNHFGLRDTELNTRRVRTEVERRLQRLAEWNYDNVADKSVKVAMDLNRQSHAHTRTVYDMA